MGRHGQGILDQMEYVKLGGLAVRSLLTSKWRTDRALFTWYCVFVVDNKWVNRV